MTRRAWCVVAAALVSVASCGTGSPQWDVAAVPTSTPVVVTTTTPASATTRTTMQPKTTTTRRRAAPVSPLSKVRGDQAVVVTASEYGATRATLTAYERGAGGWKVAFGPWGAWVGSKGIAPPGAKREGDGRTPSGTYGLDFFFGIERDPGVKFPYRVVTGPNIVWVEDPSSPNYNRWVDTDHEDAGNQPDSMYKPQYTYGAVVAYNTAARTPGLGSGIFLHISRNKPSAGCITLPVDQLLAVMRWLDPAASPVVVIGVG